VTTITAAISPAATARAVGVFSLERTGGAFVMSPASSTDNPPMMAVGFMEFLWKPQVTVVAAGGGYRSDHGLTAGLAPYGSADSSAAIDEHDDFLDSCRK